ncbi:DUF3304 domain-containing protein [Billgrantia kenyensis]|uniref:DUF3304 domain-containing protein n=1 Tax=Billgrantia kenyensis TaxID=321266 RepID=A0A7V9W239_9GAMM|nr:DUF3304 domain-containing protein [Halomonas kenyensis]MBA2779615.1 DUF3304 domain-containing protein [Halomonas kenyensis]MCG6662327.1 DUF3304 domain-containing protein [Halomonas kenyensis]
MLVRWIWNWLFNQIWYGLPKGARWGLGVLFAGYFVWLFFMPSLHPIPTDTSIEGRSHIDRYINHFWVNGRGGGNVGPYGGGGVVCCQRISGDTAEVEWIYGRTVEEFERGDEPERHRVTLPMPERTREDRYLHVHFLPNHEVKLGWSPDLISPYAHLPRRLDQVEEEAAP